MNKELLCTLDEILKSDVYNWFTIFLLDLFLKVVSFIENYINHMLKGLVVAHQLFFKQHVSMNRSVNNFKSEIYFFTNLYMYLCTSNVSKIFFFFWYYLPTPPLGQDMTQGQFLSEV